MTVGVAHRAAGFTIGTGLGDVVSIVTVFTGLNHAIAAVGKAAAIRTCVGIYIVAIIALLVTGIHDPVTAATGGTRDILTGVRTHCAATYPVVAALGDAIAVIAFFTLIRFHHAIATIAFHPIDLVAVCIADGAVIVAVTTGLCDSIAIITLLKG